MTPAVETPRKAFRDSATLAALSGLASGAIGAYCYYDELLRPISHTFAVWLTLAIALTARRPARIAMRNATLAFIGAVIAFYAGRELLYVTLYPGQPYQLNYPVVALWLGFAVAAGLGIGWLLHGVGRSDWAGAVSVAIASGLLLGDMIHRSYFYQDDIPVTATITAAGLLVLICLVGIQRVRQMLRIALLTPVTTALAILAVSAPDLLEQYVLVGF